MQVGFERAGAIAWRHASGSKDTGGQMPGKVEKVGAFQIEIERVRDAAAPNPHSSQAYCIPVQLGARR